MPVLHRVALLGNPAAGRGRGARAGEAAHARLCAAGVEVVAVEGADAAESLDLARAAVGRGVDALVAVGGDGTANLALRALDGTPIPLGLVPAGSGNDGARALGVPVGDVDGAVDRVLSGLAGGTRCTVDLAVCGGRRFLTVLAAGFDAVVTERAASMTWPRGEARYSLAVLAELHTLAPISYVLDLDGDVRRLDATLVAVGNGPSFGGGLRITHGARLDDGLLDVVVVKPIGRADLVRTYPRLRTGTHVRHRQYERHRVRRVTVAAPGVVGHADGERFGALPLTVEVRPRALTVLGCVPVRLRGEHVGAGRARHDGGTMDQTDPGSDLDLDRADRGDTDGSPASRYASYRRHRQHPVLKDFTDHYEFPLDDFQLRACREIEDGRGVLVAAPTGSGKTVVGEFAIHLALAGGTKAFYTTPIKALSNQKYADLVARYGADKVGLLTGDNTVNGEAPVVVMTTEVLRNMLYAGSHTLRGLSHVVMDEVHYLADRSRGAVWEEVIIHLPDTVTLVSLSATVSNAEEFGEWLATVRGETTTIVEERRPVPLFQHVMVGRRLHDLFASSDVDAASGFVREGAPVNDELMKVARDDWAASRIKDRRTPKGARGGGGGRGQGGGPRQVGNGRRVWIPSRYDVIQRLDRDGLLPAIVFIFSRAGCDAAVQQCLDSDLRLTTPQERDEIQGFVEGACRDLPDEDRHVLGYHDFLDAMCRGVAAHHAGMLPAFKQVVEELYLRGLCKVVFATETLALGINMPARTVVIEKLSKWNGETHADITPGEYTQLTGRAGRRGLDVEGHGVVLWQPGMNPREVAGLASTRTYPLRSSFRPSYNMAVNLVDQFGRERSRGLLEQSFAQFQADKAVVGLARQLTKADDALAGYAEAATCHLGDFMEYAALRDEIRRVEKDAGKAVRADRRQEALDSLARLKVGDVIIVPAGKFSGYAVVTDPGWVDERDGGPRPSVVTADRQARRLAMVDFPTPVEAVARLRVPKSFSSRNPQMRRDLASSLREKTHGLDVRPPSRGGRGPTSGHDGGRVGRGGDVDDKISALRTRLKAHPCHGCADREDHARWAERWFKLDRDAETLRRRIERRTNTVARQFDRVCEVLTTLDYLDGEQVTDQGRHLKRLYSELDLLAAEALRRGTWEGLTPSGLAAALSALVYESRRPDDTRAPRVPGGPDGSIKRALDETHELWAELDALERAHHLDFLRRPDVGFSWLAYRWAEGDDLDDLLGSSDLSAGDFVRQVKQLLDLAGQVASAAGDNTELRRTARQAITAMRRGVVAYSGLAEA